MKKVLIVMIALLLSVIAAVSALCQQIYNTRDEVSFSETVLYGDRNALQGTEIRTSMTWDRLLYWDTTLRPGETDSEHTVCTVYATKQPAQRGTSYLGVQMQVEYDASVSREGDENEANRLARAFDELYAKTAPGEEKSAVIRLKDYYTYYPFSIRLEFPDYSAGWSTNSPIHYSYFSHPVGDENAREVLLALNEFFTIPVLDSEKIELYLSRGSKGYSVSYGITPGVGGSDTYYMSTVSVVGESAAYFTFQPQTSHKNTVDTSLIPGGYGIYVLPYETGKNGTKLHAQNLKMTYALSSDIEIVSLSFGATEETLHLYTLEDGIPVLTVIDTAAMETLQRIEIQSETVESFSPVFTGEDFLVTVHNWDTITLLRQRDDGAYEHGFTIPACPDELDLQYIGYNAAMDFDGKRLIVAQYKQRGFYHCDFILSAYTKDGIQCVAEYACSLNAGLSGEGNYQYHCTPTSADALSVNFCE